MVRPEVDGGSRSLSTKMRHVASAGLAGVLAVSALTMAAVPASATTSGGQTSLMNGNGSGTAYIVSGYRYTVWKPTSLPTTSLYKAISSGNCYDYYRGFYWKPSAGRWYQGAQGSQLVYDGNSAPLPLLTSMATGSQVLAASYFTYQNNVSVQF